MKHIAVFLVTEGTFHKAILPKQMFTELVVALKEEGKTEVHFADQSIWVEGIYIPSKDSRTKLMAIPEPDHEQTAAKMGGKGEKR